MTRQNPPEMLAVQVIIAHWNDEETTTICLQHLKKVQYPSMQVTVVDSGSTDGSGERIQRNFSWAQVISLPENRGHAYAANAGAAFTKNTGSPYLFFLDNDAFVDPACLKALIESLESSPQVAMACPLILSNRKPGHIWYAGGYVTGLGNARHRAMGKTWREQLFHPEVVEYATSCALLIKREVFEECGGFNEELVNYSEDLELSLRARRAGYQILFVSEARVYHGESTNVIRVAGKVFRDYYTMRNRLYVTRKYATALQKLIGMPCSIFWYGVIYGFFHFLRGDWKRTRALFRGVVDFFRGRMGWREL